ncbi:MAG: hypothetical protein ABIO70_14790 [Pseudomonadota bacterium]
MPVPAWIFTRHIPKNAGWVEAFCKQHVYDGPVQVEGGLFSVSESDCMWESSNLFAGSGNAVAVRYGRAVNGYYLRGVVFEDDLGAQGGAMVGAVFLSRPIPPGMTLVQAIAAFREKYGTRGLTACDASARGVTCVDQWTGRLSPNTQAADFYSIQYRVKQGSDYLVVNVAAINYEQGGNVLRLEVGHTPDFEAEGRNRFMDGL